MKLDDFIREQHLPDDFATSAQKYYLPFADWVEDRLTVQSGHTFILGINGAQGTGKSTLAQLVQRYLASAFDRRVVVLSIDDIYLTREQRQQLGKRVHPLLRTRGVPGTHDVDLGVSVIERLQSLQEGETTRIPRFDKSRDDRCAQDDWPLVEGPIDLIIFEGWCVGSRACADIELLEPMNALEATNDADGKWRHYVNDRLRKHYVPLFERLDALLFLQAPDFDVVLEWRLQQEQELRRTAKAGANEIMSAEQIADFVQHYERITRHNDEVLPSFADVVIKLNREHAAVSLRSDESIGRRLSLTARKR